MQDNILDPSNAKSQNKKESLFSKLKEEFILIGIENPATQLTSRNLTEFEKEASNILFTPVSCQENYSGNYDNYVAKTLSQIFSLQKLPYEKTLSDPDIYKNYPSKEIKNCLNSNKKLILLDLDETLIHTEFDLTDKNLNAYDTIIRFKDDSDEYHEIGIFLRNGVQKFLTTLNIYFNIGIFTAADKDYADAVIRYLDPNQNIIKFCLYRNNCVNVNDLINIKYLRIIKDIDLKKTVLVDNNMYSFSAQLSNGILINSFYGDKNDVELFNVLEYLVEFILPAEDVREVNEKFFTFKRLSEELQ